jgi:asparagine synthase (glutamine-hydrolysing)
VLSTLKQKSEIIKTSSARNGKNHSSSWTRLERNFSNDKAILAHERLAIVDPASGKQPLFSEDKKLVLAANGEIYNHRELRKQFEGNINFKQKVIVK